MADTDPCYENGHTLANGERPTSAGTYICEVCSTKFTVVDSNAELARYLKGTSNPTQSPYTD